MGQPSRADKVAAFRDLHESEGAFLFPNPWDRGSALMLQNIGFDALATSSGAVAWTRGKIDGEATLEEKMAHCRDLADATRVPIAADLGKGFGDAPEDVAQTIRAAAAAGMAGGSIEDASGVYDGDTYSIEHAVERVAAAVEAAAGIDGGFVLTARCENFVRGGTDFDDTMKRIKAYEAAGADVLFAPGLSDLEQIRTMAQETIRPNSVLVGFKGMDVPFDALVDAGVKRVSLGTDLARIAYGGALLAANEWRETHDIAKHDSPARSSDIMKALKEI